MLSFPLRTASELRPFVRTMLIPRGIASRQPSNGTILRKCHPYVNLATIDASTPRVLKFELPAGDDERFFQVLIDAKHSAGAVLFGRVGLGNHGPAEIQIGNTKVFCGETAFVLRRLSFMYAMAPSDTDAHICEVWDSILQVDTPHGCQAASRGLRSHLFKGAEWDADSKDQMFSMLLSKYANDEAAYDHFKAISDILSSNHVANVCFVEVGKDKNWASGVSGDKTLEALLALDEITPAAVAGVVSVLGGQNKLGQAYDLLYDAFMASEGQNFESFKQFVAEEMPPLFVNAIAAVTVEVTTEPAVVAVEVTTEPAVVVEEPAAVVAAAVAEAAVAEAAVAEAAVVEAAVVEAAVVEEPAAVVEPLAKRSRSEAF